jgi:uncharacterized membrane protein
MHERAAANPPAIGLQGWRRKALHATVYEAIAIVMVALLMQPLAEHGLSQSAPLAVGTSVIAMVWNITFNALFEAWERRQQRPGEQRSRSLMRRAVHAVGFEGGLVALTVPLIAWSLHLGWWPALLADLGLVSVFLVYTFCFNWCFDRVFGLPI